MLSEFVVTWVLQVSDHSRQTYLLRDVWHPIDYHSPRAGAKYHQKQPQGPRITVAVVQGGHNQYNRPGVSSFLLLEEMWLISWYLLERRLSRAKLHDKDRLSNTIMPQIIS